MTPVPSATPVDPLHTRTGIMLAILPTVKAALSAIPKINLTDTVRRAYRAIVTLGIRMMLDIGADPTLIMTECGTALAVEMKERAIVAKEQGATMPSPTLPS